MRGFIRIMGIFAFELGVYVVILSSIYRALQ
jgi:hypothetical protein